MIGSIGLHKDIHQSEDIRMLGYVLSENTGVKE